MSIEINKSSHSLLNLWPWLSCLHIVRNLSRVAVVPLKRANNLSILLSQVSKVTSPNRANQNNSGVQKTYWASFGLKPLRPSIGCLLILWHIIQLLLEKAISRLRVAQGGVIMAIVLTYIGCDFKLALDREAINRGQVKYSKIVISIKIDRNYESCVLKFI